MRQEYRLSAPLLGQTIELCATQLDDGIAVLLTGGCSHHIGAVTTTAGQGEKLLTHRFPSHKDHLVGERFARLLADTFDCPVSVCCGIHFHQPTPAEITQIVKRCEDLLRELIERIHSQHNLSAELF